MVEGLAMTMKPWSVLSLLAAMLTMVACSSGDELLPARSLLGALGDKLDPTKIESDFVEPTRALLDEDGRDFFRLDIPKRETKALLLYVSSNGPVETWASADGATFSFRNGVLVQTRGLGPDLMSSSAPTAATLARGTGEVRRVQYFLGPNDQTVALAYRCNLASAGRESIDVAGLRYTTTRVSETCEGGGPPFQNLYWFESGTRMRQSEQWVSPDVGKMELFDLRR